MSSLGRAAALSLVFAACKSAIPPKETPVNPPAGRASGPNYQADVNDYARKQFDRGRAIFRDETFGSEEFWSDKLQLHRAILGAKQGGVGPGLSPKAALAVGLKVDASRLSESLASGIKDGSVNLDDPASTVALLKANSVVGVHAFVERDKVVSIGITCALCHS